jgi:hypothetical protein
MCWHYDHCKGRMVKGINLLNALHHSGEVSVPVAFEVIRKPIQFCDVATSSRAGQVDLVMGRDLLQPIQRQVVGVFADQAHGRQATVDHSRRDWRRRHGLASMA